MGLQPSACWEGGTFWAIGTLMWLVPLLLPQNSNLLPTWNILSLIRKMSSRVIKRRVFEYISSIPNPIPLFITYVTRSSLFNLSNASVFIYKIAWSNSVYLIELLIGYKWYNPWCYDHSNYKCQSIIIIISTYQLVICILHHLKLFCFPCLWLCITHHRAVYRSRLSILSTLRRPSKSRHWG